MKVRAVFERDNPFLSPKETETLAMLGEGFSRDEVAAMKFRTRSTVNAQITSVLNKLDASNLVHAIAIATIKGILRYEKMLVLCLVVTLGFTSVTPSTAYAVDLMEQGPQSTDKPFARYRVRGQGRLKVRVRGGRGGEF